LGEDEALAHIYATLLPRQFVYEAMARVDPQRAKRVHFQGPQQTLPWEDKLEILFCEGTGVLEAVQKPVKSYYKRASAPGIIRARTATITLRDQLGAAYPALRCLVGRILQRHTSEEELGHMKDVSPFYKVVVSAYVPYFVDLGYAFADIAFVYPQERRYGITFRDLVFKDKSVGISVCTDWTPKEHAIINDGLAQLEPCPPWEIPESPSPALREAVETRLHGLISEFGRGGEKARINGLPSLTYRVRLEDFTTDVADTLLRAFHERRFPLVAFDFAIRPIAASLGQSIVVVDLVLYHN
jgi:hypothetical protein